MSVENTLAERGKRYGDFADHAAIAQAVQDSMRLTRPNGWERLNDMQRQALTVIADKIARILSGDPNYADNWHDIQGYAKLVEDRLPTESRGVNSDLTAVFTPGSHPINVDLRGAALTEAVQAYAARGVPGAAEEPATQIDDTSDRQQAVQQNDNDGAVYDDPWYGAPEWARFKAQDYDGTWYWFKAKPELQSGIWHSEDLYQYAYDGPHSNPDWRDTLIERP